MKSKFRLVVMAAIWGSALSPALLAANQPLPGRVPEMVARMHLPAIGRLPETNHLAVPIGLPLRNRKSLTNLLKQLYDPAGTNFHHFLTPRQFREQFGPTEQDYQSVIAFAKINGLNITRTHPNRTLLDVSGTVADIEHTFHVTLRLYRHPTESRMFYAPDAKPSVAANIPLLSVVGLDNYILPRPLCHRAPAGIHAALGQPQAGAGPDGTYLGNDFRAAY